MQSWPAKPQSADSIKDLLADRVQLMFDSPSTASQYVKDGRLTILGCAGDKRRSRMPETPTLLKPGLPGFELRAMPLRRLAPGVGEAGIQPRLRPRPAAPCSPLRRQRPAHRAIRPATLCMLASPAVGGVVDEVPDAYPGSDASSTTDEGIPHRRRAGDSGQVRRPPSALPTGIIFGRACLTAKTVASDLETVIQRKHRVGAAL
jgi:hypothetical protein